MTFLRAYLTAATDREIARWTKGMRAVSPDGVDVAPRACPSCRATGRGRVRPCAMCDGTGATRRIAPVDATQVVVAHGPCGPGHQWLVALALTGGTVAYAHVRSCGVDDVRVYLPATTRGRRSTRRRTGPAGPAGAPYHRARGPVHADVVPMARWRARG